MRPDDVVDVLAVQEPAAVEGLSEVFPQHLYPFPRQVVADRWREELRNPDIDCFVIQRAGAVVGFAAVRDDEILHFGVAIGQWGSQIAAAAQYELLAHLRDRGVTRARLGVYAANARGRRFWEKHGWGPSGESMSGAMPPHAELLIYEKRLADLPTYTTRLLTPDTWNDFAALVEANNGVWGGCWCMGFHPEGLDGTAEDHQIAKRAHTDAGTVHQVLVFDGETCVGWCQFGSPAELPNIKNAKAYAHDVDALPRWRIGCIFTGSKHREKGVARAAVTAVLEEIRRAGGGVVEAYPEQVEGRKPQRGAYLHTGPETLYEELGFVRDRQIAKWRWVMRLEVKPWPADRLAPAAH